jgi:hypothetical protein
MARRGGREKEDPSASNIVDPLGLEAMTVTVLQFKKGRANFSF